MYILYTLLYDRAARVYTNFAVGRRRREKKLWRARSATFINQFAAATASAPPERDISLRLTGE